MKATKDGNRPVHRGKKTAGMPLSTLVPGTGTHTGTGTIFRRPLLWAVLRPPALPAVCRFDICLPSDILKTHPIFFPVEAFATEMRKEAMEEALSQCALFEGISDTDRDALIGISMERHLAKKAALFGGTRI